ncbi:MAG: trypsin-like peptidase domain-containing protein [Candidatus Improbicoccus pseudotrichonymphae]|uniref:Trypsin-like peptidase domain-containing protein n=1 Tax=Candidatus Improbicoccus pseudotrichonymphae TaxID=3033792 RepID=A0AA48IAU5_9FIRM|nr:MAG: trypsin-like peptidase domain-containing protein [Candidatus Improbicoccus pseudotrichonymphae]
MEKNKDQGGKERKDGFWGFGKKNKNKYGMIDYSPDKKNKFLIRIILILSFLSAFFGGILFYLWQNNEIKLPSFLNPEKKSSIIDDFQVQEGSVGDKKALSPEEIYEKTKKSVVGIAHYNVNTDMFSDLVGQGSGIVISENGYIVTNAHIVGDSKKNKIVVVFKSEDGKTEEYSAKLIGKDPKTDVALLKIEKSGLFPAIFEDSDHVKIGNRCFAVGNPCGFAFFGSYTGGIISAIGRTIDGSSVPYIQTDAALNPGNSGGPLINQYGYVIGMNTSKMSSVELEGMGFAIPSKMLLEVIKSLREKGYVGNRVKIGIVGKLVSRMHAQLNDLPLGIYIVEINSDSDLKRNGVKTGDIIMKVNGINITSYDDLDRALLNLKPGDKVSMKIFRRNSITNETREFEVSVRLIEDRGE